MPQRLVIAGDGAVKYKIAKWYTILHTCIFLFGLEYRVERMCEMAKGAYPMLWRRYSFIRIRIICSGTIWVQYFQCFKSSIDRDVIPINNSHLFQFIEDIFIIKRIGDAHLCTSPGLGFADSSKLVVSLTLLCPYTVNGDLI